MHICLHDVKLQSCGDESIAKEQRTNYIVLTDTIKYDQLFSPAISAMIITLEQD